MYCLFKFTQNVEFCMQLSHLAALLDCLSTLQYRELANPMHSKTSKTVIIRDMRWS
jgi:hypothetical protein